MEEKIKSFMRNVPQAVFIAIAKSPKGLSGLTISSFELVSLKPSITLISIDKSAKSLETFIRAIGWTISLLSDEQEEFSKLFSNNEISQSERFKINYPKSSFLKIPYIDNCIGYLECLYYKHLEIGDHFIFLSKVVNVEIINEKRPLIYYRRGYHKVL